jgi:hypothetical protein
MKHIGKKEMTQRTMTCEIGFSLWLQTTDGIEEAKKEK